jgi:hypothetical protein
VLNTEDQSEGVSAGQRVCEMLVAEGEEGDALGPEMPAEQMRRLRRDSREAREDTRAVTESSEVMSQGPRGVILPGRREGCALLRRWGRRPFGCR